MLGLSEKSQTKQKNSAGYRNHSSSITDEIDNHDRTRPQANRASMSEYHMNEMCINELDRPISKEEVRQSIRNLKQGKAPGLDNVCGEYLKSAEANITPFFFLTLLFNKIYDSSCFPSDWCKSIIISLFKRGNETDPDNYRGISLLSVVSKVFTAILNKRLYTWAEKKKEKPVKTKHFNSDLHNKKRSHCVRG